MNKQKQMLWVYDEPSNQVVIKLLQYAYKRGGIDLTVDSTHDTISGVEAAVQKNYDSILVIHNLPIVDALKVVRGIRKANGVVPVNVVVNSNEEVYGSKAPTPVDEIKEAGATKVYLDAPVVSRNSDCITDLIKVAHPNYSQ